LALSNFKKFEVSIDKIEKMADETIEFESPTEVTSKRPSLATINVSTKPTTVCKIFSIMARTAKIKMTVNFSFVVRVSINFSEVMLKPSLANKIF